MTVIEPTIEMRVARLLRIDTKFVKVIDELDTVRGATTTFESKNLGLENRMDKESVEVGINPTRPVTHVHQGYNNLHWKFSSKLR